MTHPRTMPVFIAWMKYLSWFMYGNEAISIVQWQNVTNIGNIFNEKSRGHVYRFLVCKKCIIFIECSADPSLPCLQTGEEVLESRSFAKSHEWFDFTGMVVLYCAFNFFAYMALLIKSRQK